MTTNKVSIRSSVNPWSPFAAEVLVSLHQIITRTHGHFHQTSGVEITSRAVSLKESRGQLPHLCIPTGHVPELPCCSPPRPHHQHWRGHACKDAIDRSGNSGDQRKQVVGGGPDAWIQSLQEAPDWTRFQPPLLGDLARSPHHTIGSSASGGILIEPQPLPISVVLDNSVAVCG